MTEILELSLSDRRGEVSAWTIRSHRSRPLFTFIDRIAATDAAETGDCREALTLFLRGARLAEHQNKETVTVTHFEQLTAHEYGTNHRIRHE